jgi:DNA-binding Xre family transcriptional regulator
MKRQVDYQWQLREVMATRGIFIASDLAPLLAERGIDLSSTQIWRLVTQKPARLSLPVLAALCDILEVTPADLITTSAETYTGLRTATAGAEVTEMADTIRPKRARITGESKQ